MAHPALAPSLPGAPRARVEALAAEFPTALAALAEETARRTGAAPPRLQMPESFVWTLAAALALSEDEGDPRPHEADLLRRHYLRFLPEVRIEQMLAVGPARRVLHAPLRWDRMPRLRAAIARLLALLPPASVAAWLGSADADEVLAACPTLEALYQRTYYGGYLPLLYGAPMDLQRLCGQLDGGAPIEQVVERSLGAAVLHELSHCHRGRAAIFPPYLDECLASYLGTRALPAHAFPEPGGPEALYGTPWLLQVGQALAQVATAHTAPAAEGPRGTEEPIFRAHCGAVPWRAVLPPGLLAAVRRLGWDEYRARRDAHMLSSNYTPEPWLKLFTLAAAGALPPPERQSELTLEGLGALSWSDIPTGPETAHDEETLRYGLRALCLRNRLEGGTFRVVRAPPAGPVQVDLASCQLRCAASDGPDGVGPAGPRVLRYLFPPATAARLRRQGISGYTLTLTELADTPDGLPDGLVDALREGAPGHAHAHAHVHVHAGPGYVLERARPERLDQV